MSATTYLRQARETIFPPASNPHGPLPVLLLGWTVVTGLVDAYSYLELHHVFVANMTGNVVFLGFSLAGAPGFLWWASLLAIAAFMVGANIGGRFLASNTGQHRSRLLYYAGTTQLALFIASALLALALPPADATLSLAALVILLSVAMGLQNSIARGLSVPDLTTTVLTLTITGLAGDGSGAGKKNNVGRRVLAIVSMALGALIGGLMVQAEAPALALIASAALTAAITWRAFAHRNDDAAWVKRK
ncbi:YoaK family protein [Corynebacterium mayonis]|uniref:YoaK family protein n=1 Tax=Corynebacterium mayonis TaxID=3062461 RepID=UPI00313FF4DA